MEMEKGNGSSCSHSGEGAYFVKGDGVHIMFNGVKIEGMVMERRNEYCKVSFSGNEGSNAAKAIWVLSSSLSPQKAPRDKSIAEGMVSENSISHSNRSGSPRMLLATHCEPESCPKPVVSSTVAAESKVRGAAEVEVSKNCSASAESSDEAESEFEDEVSSRVHGADIISQASTAKGGLVYFRAFHRGGIKYNVGDCVYLATEDDESSYVGMITKCFTEWIGPAPAKCFDETGGIRIGINWFYKVDDVQNRKRLRLRRDGRLLLASQHEDVNSTDAIAGKAAVYFYPTDMENLLVPKEASSSPDSEMRITISHEGLQKTIETNKYAFVCCAAYNLKQKNRTKLLELTQKGLKGDGWALLNQRLLKSVDEQLAEYETAKSSSEYKENEKRVSVPSVPTAATFTAKSSGVKRKRRQRPARSLLNFVSTRSNEPNESGGFRLDRPAEWRKCRPEWIIGYNPCQSCK